MCYSVYFMCCHDPFGAARRHVFPSNPMNLAKRIAGVAKPAQVAAVDKSR
jgi:hypothetical protein